MKKLRQSLIRSVGRWKSYYKTKIKIWLLVPYATQIHCCRSKTDTLLSSILLWNWEGNRSLRCSSWTSPATGPACFQWDGNKPQYSLIGVFMNTNTTTQQRKSLLDKNKHRLTKVTDSLSLSLYHLLTGANVYFLPSMCSEFIPRHQHLVHPCSLGTSKLCSWIPSSQGRCWEHAERPCHIAYELLRGGISGRVGC